MTEQKVIQGDCLEVMKTFPDKSFDFIFADYPFNCQDGRKNYEKFIEDTSLEFLRISKDVSNLLVINSPAKIFTTSKFFQDWTLVNGVALIRRGSLRPAWHLGFQHNYLLILNRGGIKNKWNGTKKNHDKSFPTDVITYQNGYRGKGKVWHPQALQLHLVETFVRWLSNESDTILDPFLGSGTTLIAAKQLQRNAVGIEISPEYCKIARDRLDAQTPPLF